MKVNKMLLIFKVMFFIIIGIIFYQAYGLYVMRKEVNKEIENTEREVAEYTEKKKILESSIKNWILYFFSVNISPFFLLHIDLTIQYY